MHTHLPSVLKGPVTLERDWWPRGEEEPADLDEVPSIDDPDVRSELVLRIRREIAEGTYETPEKLEAALDRLLDRLEGRDEK